MFKRNPQYIWEEIENICYLFNTEDSSSIDLNEIASEIWLAIESKSSDEIAEDLLSKYSVEKDILVNDIKAFIDQALQIGIIIQL
ncbi:PqqD family protein [Lacrimispora brassicae]